MCRVDAHDQCAIVERSKFDASCGSQAGLADATFAREHKDPHNPIVRGRTHSRVLPMKEDKKGRSQLCLARSETSDPHLPSVECKVENADEYSCSRQNS